MHIDPEILEKEAMLSQKYIKEIIASGSVDNLEYYAKEVRNSFLNKELQVISKKLEEEKTPPVFRMNTVSMELDKLASQSGAIGIPRLEDALSNIKTGKQLITFGLDYIDGPSGGLTRGEISALGGRPGHGKTTLMTNLVWQLACRGYRVVLINREMRNEEVLQKLLLLNSDTLDLEDLRSPKLAKETKEDIDRIFEENRLIFDRIISYDDVSSLDGSVAKILENKPDIFFDDYIQLISFDGAERRRFQIERVMQEYKWLAKKINATGIVISQLSRDIEKRMDGVPLLSDFAEGGTIEQMAENAFFIYYPARAGEDVPEGLVELIFRKVRYGVPGKFQLTFNGKRYS